MDLQEVAAAGFALSHLPTGVLFVTQDGASLILKMTSTANSDSKNIDPTTNRRRLTKPPPTKNSTASTGPFVLPSHHSLKSSRSTTSIQRTPSAPIYPPLIHWQHSRWRTSPHPNFTKPIQLVSRPTIRQPLTCPLQRRIR